MDKNERRPGECDAVHADRDRLKRLLETAQSPTLRYHLNAFVKSPRALQRLRWSVSVAPRSPDLDETRFRLKLQK